MRGERKMAISFPGTNYGRSGRVHPDSIASVSYLTLMGLQERGKLREGVMRADVDGFVVGVTYDGRIIFAPDEFEYECDGFDDTTTQGGSR
ncbi:hypothetical protein CMI48_02000 [Candidatus Pacearchaeota archaeon]|nr:hypothetical protein [Candidatus Pacearchaeota archaeon]